MSSHHTRKHLEHEAVLTSTHKDCTQCGEVKRLENFHLSKNNRGGRHPWCKQCRSESPRCREADRNSKLKSIYGITTEDFERMAEAQDGRCGACRDELTMDRFTHVDHCHETDRVRGILCHRCNTALGLMAEDPDRILGLLSYLRRTAIAD